VFGVRSMLRSGCLKGGLFWANWSMESKFASGHVNQEAIGVAMGAMYAYVKLETVGSSIIAVTTQNRSLSPLFQPVRVFLGAKLS
jgi:hypothetical protein